MDTFRFQCPECQSSLRVSLKHAGTRKRCPQPECGKLIDIPQPQTTPPTKSTRAEKPVAATREKAKKAAKPTLASPPKRQATKSAKSVKRPAKPVDEFEEFTELEDWDDWDDLLPESTAARAQNKKPSASSKSPRKTASAKNKKSSGQKGSFWSRRNLTIGAGLLVTVCLFAFLMPSGNTGGVAEQSQSLQAESQESFSKHVQPFFQKYCYDCHGPDLQEEGLRLDDVTANPDFLTNRKMWLKVYQQVSVGSMPPKDAEIPAPEERLAVAEWLDRAINKFDCADVNNPGRVTVHRLNRNEYDNTIRDLLGVDLNLSKNFPSDDVGYGFDNIGDVLTLSPLLMERYLDAAEKAAEAAITLPDQLKLKQSFAPNQFKLSSKGVSARGIELTFASNGQAKATFNTKADGDYRFKIQVQATQAGQGDAKCQIKLNGKEIATHDVPGHRKTKTIEWTTPLPAGKQELEIAFTNDHYDPEAEDPQRRDRNLYLSAAEVSGPAKLEIKHFPENHRRLLGKHITDQAQATAAAREILTRLATRAYRRPVTLQEMDRLMQIFEITQQRKESFERSMQICLQGILVSPQFLFRLEEPADSQAAQEIYELGQYELASRLSYFLWSSMPDDQLLDAASRGLLKEPAIIEQEVRRMLKDPKAAALTKNFVGQWLGLRKLPEMEPDADLFPEYNEKLAADMARETELLFAEVLTEDRNVLELINADYTFVNERIAKLYGLKDVKGDQFRKVSLENLPRRGLIAHAGILTLTSFPNRTSPVKRGEWVLENILAQAPPPAPADVPGLEETQKANPNLSFRDQLVLHQSDPVCSSCHKLMDGIGFGLQNFDAIGRWRDREGEFPVDARGDLPDGSSFDGPRELIQILEKRPDEFTRCLSEKMLTYALGRGLEWYDKCTVDEIVAAVRRDNYRISRVIVEIALSPPFRKQRTASH